MLFNRHIVIYLKHIRNEKDNQFVLRDSKGFKESDKRLPIVLIEDLEKKKFYWVYHQEGRVPEIKLDTEESKESGQSSSHIGVQSRAGMSG
jgi:hypothetical protein